MSCSTDSSNELHSRSHHLGHEEIPPLGSNLPRPSPTIEVLALGTNVQVDEAYQCPNNDCSSDNINPHVSDLPYEALRREAGRGCPWCILYCNMIIAARPHSQIAKVQNPHRWTSPFGKKDIIMTPFNDLSPYDMPIWMHLHYANFPNPDLWQRVNVFTLHELEHDSFYFYDRTIHEPVNGVSRAIPGNTQSPDTVNDALAWLNECTTHHASCGDDSPVVLPTRVLDISSAPVRLYEPDGRLGTYACLSHCWGPKGESRVLRTTTKNFRSFTNGIPWAQLPRTFREAIHFVRGLQIRYLWIDSLCIIQDDASDWEREAGRMADIYMNCLVSIAAVNSANADEGLFTRPMDMSPSLQIAQVRLSNRSVLPIYARPYIIHNVHHNASSPLSHRGWVLQEILLAPRTIHFDKAEVYWECREAVRCECGLDSLGDPGKSTSQKTDLWQTFDTESGIDLFAKAWRKVVHLYSLRKLTYVSDTLPALSGLAKRWSSGPFREHRYLAGLWQADILNDLQWFRLPLEVDTVSYLAPSWSWASNSANGGPVSWFAAEPPSEKDVQYTRMMDAHCELEGQDPTGAVKSGYLVLRGPAIDGIITYWEYKNTHSLHPLSTYHITYVYASGVSYSYHTDASIWENGATFIPSPSPVKVLLMQRCQYGREYPNTPVEGFWTCLILKASPNSPDRYKRIGILRVLDTTPSIEVEVELSGDSVETVRQELRYLSRAERRSMKDKEKHSKAYRTTNEQFFRGFENVALADYTII